MSRSTSSRRRWPSPTTEASLPPARTKQPSQLPATAAVAAPISPAPPPPPPPQHSTRQVVMSIAAVEVRNVNLTLSTTTSTSTPLLATTTSMVRAKKPEWGYDSATALVQRCMRVNGWNETLAVRVLKAYRQFLFLKTVHEDWDATVLSPSVMVDQMWHQHMLDPVQYYQDCHLLCNGHVVGHNPDGMLDEQAKAQRLASTRMALEVHFANQDIDQEIWAEAFPSSNDEASFMVYIKNLNGKILTLDVNASDTGLILKSKIFAVWRIPAEDHRLYFAGKEVVNTLSLHDNGIGKDSVVILVLKLRGC